MRSNFSSNIDEVLGATARLHPQFRFAAAVALTRSVNAARSAMPGEVERVFDRPTSFTAGGFFSQPARKDRLEASVGVKDRQAQYLTYQVEGGARQPSRKALRLPAVVDLNEFGNMPAGLIKSLVNRARQGKRATKSQAARFGVSQKLELFYGEPGDGRPAGIYKRITLGASRQQLVPVVVFPKQAARYERRFDFYGFAARVVDRTFDVELARSWREAMATAR
jgi:hypothetical protein